MDHCVGHLCNIQIVGYHDNGKAELLMKPADVVQYLTAGLLIQCPGGLI